MPFFNEKRVAVNYPNSRYTSFLLPRQYPYHQGIIGKHGRSILGNSNRHGKLLVSSHLPAHKR